MDHQQLLYIDMASADLRETRAKVAELQATYGDWIIVLQHEPTPMPGQQPPRRLLVINFTPGKAEEQMKQLVWRWVCMGMMVTPMKPQGIEESNGTIVEYEMSLFVFNDAMIHPTQWLSDFHEKPRALQVWRMINE